MTNHLVFFNPRLFYFGDPCCNLSSKQNMKYIKQSARLFLFLFALLSLPGFSQKNLASPRDSVSASLAGAVFTINYGSPAVKGRAIWGRLVPYGQVWRAGANEATRFRISKPIKIQGKFLVAGEYGLFAIPGEKQWTIIFNKVADQWGAYEYSSKEDALRVTVTPEYKEEVQEHLNYQLKDNRVIMRWEHLLIPLLIESAH